MILRISVVATLLLASTAFPAGAQQRDAQVLKPGQFRLLAEGAFSDAESRFGENARERLATDFDAVLNAQRFFPVRAFVSAVEAFYLAAGLTGPDSELIAGVVTLGVRSSARVLPLGFSLGLIPRLEIGATIPVFREERLATRIDLADGNLGINPAPDANSALLAAFGAAGEAVGGSSFLPLAGSAGGQDLQRVVMSLTGHALQLPATALTPTEFVATFPIDPLRYTVGPWQTGDPELSARVGILDSLEGRYFPTGDGWNYRLTALGSVRLPLGASPDSVLSLGLGPGTGAGGWNAGGSMDLFLGQTAWLSAGITRTAVSASDAVGLVPEAGGLVLGSPAIAYRRGASSVWDLFLAPRYRMTPAISVGAVATHRSTGSGAFVTADRSIAVAASRVSSFGLLARYSTLPAGEAGASLLPFEVSAGYLGAFAGSGNAPISRTAFLSVSLLPKLWGNQGRSDDP